MGHAIVAHFVCPGCQGENTERDTLTGRCLACVSEMSTRQINRIAREQDESAKWPVRGKFDVTERAIRRLRERRRQNGSPADGLEYAFALDEEISRVVNDPRNQ